MRLNGCALVMVGLPDVDTAAQVVCGWVAAHLGGSRASIRVERLAG